MTLKPFSAQQLRLLRWWCTEEGRALDGVICDGAVRSGKTLCMSVSFAAWAMATFSGGAFALCGKTIRSVRRNVAVPLLSALRGLGFEVREKLSSNLIEVACGNVVNTFYLFGGKDEGSAALIQGMTLCGVLFDEAALMPRSFVEQAVARCSVGGSKLWFNCNPEYPRHWFCTEWVKKAEEKHLLYLHFTMRDNPSLSPEMLRRYETLYSGAFYRRFVLGEWVASEGLVYPFMSDDEMLSDPPEEPCEEYVISCDYGTVNPSSFGLWGRVRGVWYRLAEYYYSSQREGIARTDEEHYEGLCRLAGERPVRRVIVDPSAASFIEVIKRHGVFRVTPGVNDVLSGIRRVSCALKQGEIRICKTCEDSIREFGLYCWDSSGRDFPKKENDHAMDDIRYFVSTWLQGREEDFFAVSLPRSGGNGR